GLLFTQVPLYARTSQVGSGHIVSQGQFLAENSHPGCPFHENLVIGQELIHFRDDGLKLPQKFSGLFHKSFWDIVGNPSHPVIVVEETSPTGPFKQIQDLLPFSEAMQERSKGTNIHGVGPNGKKMTGNSI